MRSLYRFSPIGTLEELRSAIQYVGKKTTELCKKITGNEYGISSLTIFSHYPEEFETLKGIALKLGTVESENNGPFIRLSEPIYLQDNKLNLLRIRYPDPHRSQVGCCDFKIESYEGFKNEYLSKNSDNLKVIKRPDYEMIEFFDPGYDVLAYVVSD